MTLLKNNQNKIVFSIAISIAVVGLISVSLQESCEIKHVLLIKDMDTHEQYLDPDFCYSLLEQIDAFNEQCDAYLEIPDCG